MAPAREERRLKGGSGLAIAAGASALLALGKLVVGILSGSLVVLASAGDSFADALMSAVNWWGYRHARSPADDEHPWGHGKVEGALAMGQGMLLLGVVASILVTCVLALFAERPPPQVGLATVTLAVSGVTSAGLTYLLSRPDMVGRSVVIEADATHYRIDMLTAATGIAGLLLVGATGWVWLDPALGIAIVVFMARDCVHVLRKGAAEILDEALPAEELEQLRAVLERNERRVVEFHGLRTRRSGPLRFVEVHVVLEPERSFGEVHLLVQDIGRQIQEALPGTRVLVHPDARGMVDHVDVHLEGEPRGPDPASSDALEEGPPPAPPLGPP